MAYVTPGNLAWTSRARGTSLLGTSGIVIFAFMGIESGLGPSGEVRDPSRTVPRAAFLALIGVCVLYLAVQAVAQGILGPALGSTRITPLAAAAGAAVGEPGRIVMLIGAAVSMLGMLFGAGSGQPAHRLRAGARRVPAALHRRRASDVSHAASGPSSPARSWSSGMALTGTFERLLIISNIAGLIVYAMVALAAVMLRRGTSRADGEPFRCPGGPLVHSWPCARNWMDADGDRVRPGPGWLAILLALTGIAYLLRRRWAGDGLTHQKSPVEIQNGTRRPAANRGNQADFALLGNGIEVASRLEP